MANRLIREQSPYLRQHAHNPVDWYPWSDEAFARASEEGRPVLVSIGYAACHWCHVMERESFEDPEVAAFMNSRFICVKVDREEHPDVDHLYMDAVQAISGSGGWPLNVFVTPGRIPFYGGTYYPPVSMYQRPSWKELLHEIARIWDEQPEQVRMQADQLTEYLQNASRTVSPAADGSRTRETAGKMAGALLAQADTLHGGFGGAPKFPATMSIAFLLEHYYGTGHRPALDQALLSLDCMLSGGIYDHLGGGLARYATDTAWLIPHFEKMLYDNALLVLVLCDAWSLTGNERYRTAAVQTLEFAERELKSPQGGYYCALDADSEGEEGLYYTWTAAEWQELIQDEAVSAYFGITGEGHLEGRNILHTPRSVEEIAGRFGLTVAGLQERIRIACGRLLEHRDKRERPLTDDKSLLSWNALMNQALTRAAAAFGSAEYAARAASHMDWMMKAFNTDSGWVRVWQEGNGRIPAKLDDYAYLIGSLLKLGALRGEDACFTRAEELMEFVIQEFKDPQGPFFYYTSYRQQDIPVRKIELHDGAMPSANAIQAENLLLLSILTGRTEWQQQAEDMLSAMTGDSLRYPRSFACWATLIQRMVYGLKLVVTAEVHSRTLQEKYLPHAFVVTSKKEISVLPVMRSGYLQGESPIFVCSLQSCLAPVYEIQDALAVLHPSDQEGSGPV